MSEMSTTVPAADEPQSVEEFLGVTRKPRWRRWAKFWIPGLLVLAVVGCVVAGSGSISRAAETRSPNTSPRRWYSGRWPSK